MNTELKFPSSDKAVDEKIKRLINQAAHIRESYRFIDKHKEKQQ